MMAALRVLCGALFAIAVVAASSAQAERRVALVIGNSAYKHAIALRNTLNDASAIAASLKGVGFETVELALEQDARAMRQTIRAFSTQAADADVALVYFAGHGLEVDGRNYLIPTDAKLANDIDLDFEAVPLQLLMRTMEAAKRMRIVILDACRNNPFAAQMAISGRVSRSLGRGLAKVEPTADTLVAFAAKDGTVADDGTGAHSPYATALLQHLPTPGLEIGLLFRRVRDSVLALTDRQQEPFVYGSIGGQEFYFNAPPRTVSSAAPAPAAPGLSYEREAELALWTAVRDSKDPKLIAGYIDRFPEGLYVAVARRRIDQLKAEAGEIKLASVPPAGAADPAGADKTSLGRDLQRELKRVGCNPGDADGTWSKKSQAALQRFNQRTRLALYVDEPSPAALQAVSSQAVRVCPEICGAGEKLDDDGNCIKIQARSVAPKPSPTTRSPGVSATVAAPGGSGGGRCRDGDMARCRERCAEGSQVACQRMQRGF